MIRVNIEKETIAKSVATDSSKCWIAESIKAQVPWARNVSVDLATVRFSDLEKGLRFVYLTPYAAQLKLLEFDEGKVPEPFSFLLRGAHVTRAGKLPPATTPTNVAARVKGKAERAKRTAERKAERSAKRRATNHAKVKGAARLVKSREGSTALPRRVGGRRPPQLRMLRRFGIRAFRGASIDRKAAAKTSAASVVE